MSDVSRLRRSSAGEKGWATPRSPNGSVSPTLAQPTAPWPPGWPNPPRKRRRVRGLWIREQDRMLGELSQHLWAVLDRLDLFDNSRLRIVDALFRVSVQRCRLLGLFTPSVALRSVVAPGHPD
jgi:hypothetical protein